MGINKPQGCRGASSQLVSFHRQLSPAPPTGRMSVPHIWDGTNRGQCVVTPSMLNRANKCGVISFPKCLLWSSLFSTWEFCSNLSAYIGFHLGSYLPKPSLAQDVDLFVWFLWLTELPEVENFFIRNARICWLWAALCTCPSPVVKTVSLIHCQQWR